MPYQPKREEIYRYYRTRPKSEMEKRTWLRTVFRYVECSEKIWMGKLPAYHFGEGTYERSGRSGRNSCNSGHATMRGIHFAFLKDVSTYDPQKTKTNGKERAVVNLDTGERFETLAAAAKSIGINSNSVQCVCARKPHCYRAGGFRWAYAENAEAVKAEKIPQMQAKKVLCIETGEIFKTTGSAAKAKGLKHGEDVRRACKSAGRCKAAGFHWKYVEEVS